MAFVFSGARINNIYLSFYFLTFYFPVNSLTNSGAS